jgi:hypothetical protein
MEKSLEQCVLFMCAKESNPLVLIRYPVKREKVIFQIIGLITKLYYEIIGLY